MSHIESLVRLITKMVGLIDEEMMLISLPGRDLGEGSPASPTPAGNVYLTALQCCIGGAMEATLGRSTAACAFAITN